MWKHALKNLAAHKLRLALTAVAVILGVAFMAGTLVLTGTIKRSIDGIFTQATSGYQVVVWASSPYKSSGDFTSGGGGSGGVTNSRPLTPASLLPVVQATPGVEAAAGSIQGQVEATGPDGKALSSGGVPTIAVAWNPNPKMAALQLRSGRDPTGPGQAVVDAKTASKHHLHIGDTITVVGNGTPQHVAIVGTLGFGQQDTIAGATLLAFSYPVAADLVAKPGYFDQIQVLASPGTNTDTLISAIGARLPRGFEAVSASTVASQDANGVNSFINTFNDVLLAFAFIALFVGAFLIFNTFSILVGQRTRELALLRALGASRGQVTRSVVVEAAFTGLAGSIVGILVGIGLAALLIALLRSLLDLGHTSLVISAGTIVAGLVVGTLVTTVAALGPAVRASRVAPVAAMRDDATIAETSLRRRAIIGGVVTVAGLVALFAGLSAGGGIAVVGIGAAATFVGIAMLLPFLVGPIVRVLGAPLATVGVTGRLSQENAARSPRRTATTAATLMIGLALVAGIATLASSVNASFGALFTRTLKADYVVTSSNGTFPPTVADLVKSAPAVDSLTPFTEVQFHLGNATHSMSALDAVTGPELVKIDMVTGNTSALARGEILVDSTVAGDDHLAVGDKISMGFAATGTHTYTVGGTYKTNQLLDNYICSIDVAAAATNQLQYEAILVSASHPSTPTQDGIRQALSTYPSLKVQTASEYVGSQKQQTEGFLRFVYVLLGLSIVIALIGVINTLLLSVLERTHEIGLLRAVGMRRGQVRSMIRGEAVVVSVLGAVLGLVLGVGLGAAIVHSLSSSGITEVAIPWSTIVVVLILAILFGIFASIFPARRAAKLNVLAAISAE